MADTCTRCGMEAEYSIILSTYSASASGQRQVRFCAECYAAHRAWLSVRVPSCDVGGGAEIERPKDDRDLLRDVARQRDAALADLRGVTERWKEATEEIATLRLAIGTLPDAQVLSPLSVSPDGHNRTSDRVGVRGRKATCSCGWGSERGGWGPRGQPTRAKTDTWRGCCRRHGGRTPGCRPAPSCSRTDTTTGEVGDE
jgi:hypothetical protein